MSDKIKKIILIVGAVVVLGLIIGLGITASKMVSYREAWGVEISNIRGWQERYDSLSGEDRLLQHSIAELETMQDATVKELLRTKDSLRLKDKKISAMAALQTNLKKTDTILFRDTIFAEPEFCLDTVIGSVPWLWSDVHLRYPGEVAINTYVKSQKYIYVYNRKETIKPPKKCAFLRFFQRKHWVTTVKTIEENPFVESSDNIFIYTGEKQQ